jgi:hypothetical protein
MNKPLSIYGNRRLLASAAIFLGLITVLVVWRAFAAGSVGMAIFLAVLFGLPLACYVAALLRRGPAVVIGPAGLSGSRVGRTIRWASISDIHATRHRGAFGVYHDVVVRVKRADPSRRDDRRAPLASSAPTETVEFSIDLLTMRSSDIVALLQERIGRTVETKRQTLVSVPTVA